MKNYILVFSVLIFYATSFAQNDTIAAKGYGYNWKLASTFTLEVNTFIPISDLSKTLDRSIGFGFYFGFPLNHKLRLDIGTSVFLPKEKGRIQFLKNDKVFEGGTSLSGTLGVWLTRVKRISDKTYWDTRFGSGIGFFQTDIETGKPKEENDSVYGAETVFFNVGTALRTQIFKSNIGLKLDYFLVPYNLLKNRFPDDFGSQYLTLGLVYGF